MPAASRRWIIRPTGASSRAGGIDGTIKLCEVATGKQIKVIDVGTGPVHAIAFSPGGKQLASAGQSNDVQTWDVATGTQLEAFKGHTRWVRFCVFSPNGKTFA